MPTRPAWLCDNRAMARSKSSRRWLKEHFDDPHVKKAQALGLRSRSAFKLEEIQQRHRLIRPGMTVVDLGAAPGGWSQLAAGWLQGRGRLIALDRLELAPLAGVEFLRGDFTEADTLARLEAALAGAPVDLVMSDLAPNISGVKAIDAPRAMYLAELVLDFARHRLTGGGSMLTKVFQGAGFDSFVAEVRRCFDQTQVFKPRASRARSREMYILARGFRG